MSYSANKNRYQNMQYRNCGSSGLKLPLISVGLWHNFGGSRGMSPESKKILFTSFDAGITHFDLANNYGPPYGSAEANFGKVMQSDFKKYRDEMIISSKAHSTIAMRYCLILSARVCFMFSFKYIITFSYAYMSFSDLRCTGYAYVLMNCDIQCERCDE